MSRIRSLAFATVLFAAILAATPVALSQQVECKEPGAITSLAKGWEKIAPPRFTLDPQTLTDLAVDPSDPARLVVTNNKEVMASNDGGCTWKSVHLDPAALAIHVEVAGSGSQARLILVTSQAQGVLVDISKDWGQSWVRSTDAEQKLVGYLFCNYSIGGFPPSYGGHLPVAPAPSDPKTIYLCLEPTANRYNDVLYFIFASNDGGMTWEQRSDSNATLQEFTSRYGGPFSDGIVRLYVDPIEPKNVWTLGSMTPQSLNPTDGVGDAWHSFVSASTDGARTWTEVKRVKGHYPYSDLNIRHDVGTPPVITISSNAQPECQVEETGCLVASPDGGASWSTTPAPLGLTPLLMQPGRHPDRAVVVTHTPFFGSGVHRYDFRRTTWVDLTPPDPVQYPFDLVSSSRGKAVSFYFVGSAAIDRYTGRI